MNKELFLGFNDDCNCTYTTRDGRNCQLTLDALFGIMDGIPKPPKIFTMSIELHENGLIPSNAIIFGKDVADALEEALKGLTK